ncbi:MAG: rhodanese-like domain-containing protein [Alphaproteobacteria bacterium]|jgi:rhodanese-related sulfurtransferase|nr:rhodanese-like domain-containing protein [Alphaproteobacteria bacterium]
MGDSQNSITADRLDQLIGTSECPVIVDVRRRPAFDESDRTIAGAEWRDHERAADWAADLPDGAAVVVYCVHGHQVSQGAAAALRSAGLDAVFLEGGIEGFIEAGGETAAK